MEEIIDFTKFINNGTREHTPTHILIGAISKIVIDIQDTKGKTKKEIDSNERSYIDGLAVLQDYGKDHTVSNIDYKALSFYMDMLYGDKNRKEWSGEMDFFEKYGQLYYEIYETASLFLYEQISSEYTKYEITLIEQKCTLFLEQEYRKSSDFNQKSLIRSLIHLLPYVIKRLKTLFFL